jgi:hypothetical protein
MIREKSWFGVNRRKVIFSFACFPVFHLVLLLNNNKKVGVNALPERVGQLNAQVSGIQTLFTFNSNTV